MNAEELNKQMAEQLQEIFQREQIFSKQYKHYKELYVSRDKLVKELEDVIADLTQTIE
jgi:hypothetical protein